jgi:hypothetical protein
MKNICTHFNQTSYVMASREIKIVASALGGCVLPYFRMKGKEICPYYITPWWNEKPFEGGGNITTVCRGNFLCFPMGGDPTGHNTNGEVVPIHGNCANDVWGIVGMEYGGDISKLTMEYEDTQCDGKIIKEIEIRKGEPVVYERDIISGYDGQYPVCYHPMIDLGSVEGGNHISISKPVIGFTTGVYHERPENGGYVLFKQQQIKDIRKVESVYGEEIDLTKQPLKKGIEEILQLVCDDSKKFTYAAVTNFKRGYVYFQLKNPKKLTSTMMWISNGGRYYEPWNGRVYGCLGLEETTSFFHFGSQKSAEKNFIHDLGVNTCVDMKRDHRYPFEIITGVVAAPKGYQGVKDIVESDGGVTIYGIGGEITKVRLDLDFVK